MMIRNLSRTGGYRFHSPHRRAPLCFPLKQSAKLQTCRPLPQGQAWRALSYLEPEDIFLCEQIADPLQKRRQTHRDYESSWHRFVFARVRLAASLGIQSYPTAGNPVISLPGQRKLNQFAERLNVGIRFRFHEAKKFSTTHWIQSYLDHTILLADDGILFYHDLYHAIGFLFLPAFIFQMAKSRIHFLFKMIKDCGMDPTNTLRAMPDLDTIVSDNPLHRLWAQLHFVVQGIDEISAGMHLVDEIAFFGAGEESVFYFFLLSGHLFPNERIRFWLTSNWEIGQRLLRGVNGREPPLFAQGSDPFRQLEDWLVQEQANPANHHKADSDRVAKMITEVMQAKTRMASQ